MALTGSLASGGGGGGGVSGPAGGAGSSTDNAIVRWDGANGTAIQNSVVTISDVGAIAGATLLDVDNIRLDLNTISTTSGSLLLAPVSNTVTVVGTWNLENVNLYTTGGVTGTPQITSGAGSATVPVYTFLSDSNTGMGRAAADQLSLIAGGVEGARVTSTAIDGVLQLNVDNLRLDGNTLSSTNANGDITQAPNGTGKVSVTGSGTAGTTLFQVTSGGVSVFTVDNTNNGRILVDADGAHGQQLSITARGGGSDPEIVSTGQLRLTSGGGLVVFLNGPAQTASSLNIGGSDVGFLRNAAGVVRVTNGSSGLGNILLGRLVEANTAGTGAPNVLAVNESNSAFTNEGTTALNQHTLPAAAAGLTFTFYVQDADGVRVVADTGDTIRIAGSVSGAAGRIDSTTIGSAVTLLAINATEWVALSSTGTWVVT